MLNSPGERTLVGGARNKTLLYNGAHLGWFQCEPRAYCADNIFHHNLIVREIYKIHFLTDWMGSALKQSP